jgi:hypothetical protein
MKVFEKPLEKLAEMRHELVVFAAMCQVLKHTKGSNGK